MYEVEGQMSFADLDSSFGRMSTAHSVPGSRVERTSESSSKKSAKSSTRMPLFLDLRDGGAQGASWEMGGALLGVYTMHSFGEQPKTLMDECGFAALPNGVSVSRLSQILVDDPLPKYSLSARACQGILNRANKRGKELPKELTDALERQAGLHSEN